MKRTMLIVVTLSLMLAVAGYLLRDSVVGAYNGTDVTVSDVYARMVEIGFLGAFDAVFNSFSKVTRFALVGITMGLIYAGAYALGRRVPEGARQTPKSVMSSRVRALWVVVLSVVTLYIMTNGWSLTETSLLFGFNVTSGSVFPSLPYRLTETQNLLDYYYWISWFDFLNEWHPIALIALGLGVVWSVYKATVITFDHINHHTDGTVLSIAFMPVVALFALVVALFAPYRISHQVLPAVNCDEDEDSQEQFARYLTVLGLPSAWADRISLWVVLPNSTLNMLMDRHGSYVELIMRKMNQK
ncbi:hypothetical protein [Vibrio fluvialis]|uniref:hypothetical protein n=1 Tax=Vibrio fluvialis TaxID=676 RepID=UPI0023A99DE0|nr:hypothetical protein [Vibrio fluvialis]MDE5179135.1 hypothetical protein [Vibrio fluvialis]